MKYLCPLSSVHSLPVVGAGVVVIAGNVVGDELLDALLDLPEARLFLLEALLEQATEVGRVRRRRSQRRRRHRDRSAAGENVCNMLTIYTSHTLRFGILSRSPNTRVGSEL